MSLCPYAPRIYTTKIPTDKIRKLIGPGGKVIKGIIEQTGVKIDVSDDATVNIFASEGTSSKEGDQILVKVLVPEGNKIKLSRKAILKEPREKLKAAADKGQ